MNFTKKYSMTKYKLNYWNTLLERLTSAFPMPFYKSTNLKKNLFCFFIEFESKSVENNRVYTRDKVLYRYFYSKAALWI